MERAAKTKLTNINKQSCFFVFKRANVARFTLTPLCVCFRNLTVKNRYTPAFHKQHT